MNKPKVNVVLATYNGAKHIEQQLDSIINQTYDNITIYIRDDGSSDRTVEIVDDYAKRYNNIVVLESKENLGVPNSFYEILRKCDKADYYAFADQDDYWLPGKIERAVTKLEEEKQKDFPLLYCSAYDYYTGDGKYIRTFRLAKKYDFYKSLYYTAASGFVLVFNDELKEKVLIGLENVSRDEFGELHDRRIIRVAYLFGKIIFDDYVGARHIRHDDAVTSADSTNYSLLINWFLNELLGDDMKRQKAGIKLFCETYQTQMNNTDKKVLMDFCEDGGIFRKLFCTHRLRERISGEILLRILFLFRII